jgi:predicted 3-demethylubiquinone-9 3-methyltransferase (glyoxalase superfamily)
VISATPFLWLQHPVDDAAYFYAALFDGEVLAENYGSAMRSARIRIAGQTIELFSAGPFQELTEAFSIMVTCSTQAELDHVWEGLSRGGTPSRCGWITDRFGVTWQVVPRQLREWLSDPEAGPAVTRTMLSMVKLDFAPLEAALRGN